MTSTRSSTRLWRLLAAAVAIGFLTAVRLSATGAAPAELEKELVIVASGGAYERAMKEHFYEPFSKATGVTVRAVSATASERWPRIKAMSAVGRAEWDITVAVEASIIANQDFIARLDCRRIPNAAEQGVEGSCQESGLLIEISPTMITYSTKAFSAAAHPQSWADFWDVKKFPGPRSLPNSGSPWEVLAAALMADRVPSDKVWPLDVDRAFRKLDEIKPHVKVWWKTGDQSQQIMRDGEAVLAMMWSGRALSLKKQGAPVDIEWNQGIIDPTYWVVLKDAPHPKAAYAFLNFFMDRPEAHLAFGEQINYQTSNRRALGLLPEAERKTRPTAYMQKMVRVDSRWVGENRDRLLERWNAWLAR